MAPDKKHLRQRILFVSELKKKSAEATEIIAVIHETCKKLFRTFRNRDFDLSNRERRGQSKKIEDKKLEQLLKENPTQN